ncbi:Modification methylase PspPI [Capsicum chinense]|nr:Modification methylase PspPI [Capsicum chinense]
MDLVPEGGYWRDLPDDIQRAYMKKSYFLGGGKTGMARRLAWDQPSLTLTCAPAQNQTERCHPEYTRPLTTREYARIQTFPDEWEFYGSLSSIYRQIGDTSPESIAKALIYPRVLGTSISTTFGSQIQKFTNTVLDGFASTTSGIDIEFIDQIDSRKKYCQLKAGPNTINKDDVVTIDNHFKKIKGLARQNGMKLDINDLVVGIVYGEKEQVSGHYKSLENNHNYSLLVGPEFWERLTGDNNFYNDLLSVITDVAKEADFKSELEEIIKELAKDEEIIKLADH